VTEDEKDRLAYYKTFIEFFGVSEDEVDEWWDDYLELSDKEKAENASIQS
jgi:hypothetical protein